MRKDIAGPETESAMPLWEGLEGVVREKAREFIQQILEEEVTELLGRGKAAVDAAPGYRNGYGKARRLSGPDASLMQLSARNAARSVAGRRNRTAGRALVIMRKLPWLPGLGSRCAAEAVPQQARVADVLVDWGGRG